MGVSPDTPCSTVGIGHHEAAGRLLRRGKAILPVPKSLFTIGGAVEKILAAIAGLAICVFGVFHEAVIASASACVIGGQEHTGRSACGQVVQATMLLPLRTVPSG